MNQRPVGPTWVAAVLTVGAVVAFVLQLVLLLQIGTDWAGAYDVRSGECGWDGTCSDEGSLQVTLWCALVLVAFEIISGLALRSARRLAITIMVGCAVSWLVT